MVPGTRDNDTAETQAIRELYGASHLCPPVSSTKSFFGHTLGAAGILEFIVSILACREDFLPPTIHFAQARQGCDLDYVPNQIRSTEVDTFISNSAPSVVSMHPSSEANFATTINLVQPAKRKFGSRGLGWYHGSDVAIPISINHSAMQFSGISQVESFPVEGCGLHSRRSSQISTPAKLIPTIDTRRAEKMNRFAMVAAGLAMQAAALTCVRSIQPDMD